MTKEHITARLEPGENVALTKAVERGIAKNKNEAIQMAIQLFAKRHKIEVPA